MSLVEVLRDLRFRDLIAPLTAGLRQQNPSPSRLMFPTTGTASTVGAAFDYMVRFELQRRCAGVADGLWNAERAVARLESAVPEPIDGAIVAACRRGVKRARSHHADFVRSTPPKRTAMMIRHAVRLAKLDVFYRSGSLPADVLAVDGADCDDIGRLLRHVPWPQLITLGAIRLNPDFGMSSYAIGGADCDIIAGSTIVELKTSAKPSALADLRQLVGYLLLASAEDDAGHGQQPFGIDSVAIYYARFGSLVRYCARDVLGRPSFLQIRDTFISNATRLMSGDPLDHWRTRPEQLRLGF